MKKQIEQQTVEKKSKKNVHQVFRQHMVGTRSYAQNMLKFLSRLKKENFLSEKQWRNYCKNNPYRALKRIDVAWHKQLMSETAYANFVAKKLPWNWHNDLQPKSYCDIHSNLIANLVASYKEKNYHEKVKILRDYYIFYLASFLKYFVSTQKKSNNENNVIFQHIEYYVELVFLYLLSTYQKNVSPETWLYWKAEKFVYHLAIKALYEPDKVFTIEKYLDQATYQKTHWFQQFSVSLKNYNDVFLKRVLQKAQELKLKVKLVDSV